MLNQKGGLIDQCLAFSPHERPNMAEIYSYLYFCFVHFYIQQGSQKADQKACEYIQMKYFDANFKLENYDSNLGEAQVHKRAKVEAALISEGAK